jgi:hypothetical protein
VQPHREILRNAYFLVLADDAACIVHLVRTAEGFPTLQSIEATYEAVAHSLIGIRRHWALLIDTRAGPLRNDRAFEVILARSRARIIDRFGRSAVLVASAVGVLQVSRYAREDRRSPRVFSDEAEALAFLTSTAGPRPSRPD